MSTWDWEIIKAKYAEPAPPKTNGQQQPRPAGMGDYGPYNDAAVRGRLEDLRAAIPGERNDALYVAAKRLARIPVVDRDWLQEQLIEACEVNGLLRDGRHAVLTTIRSGYDRADLEGPLDAPEDDQNWREVTMAAFHADGDEKQDLHVLAVERKAYELRIVDEARALWTRQRATMLGQEPPDMVGMPDFLAVPDEDATYRVDNLLPVGGRALLAAQYKAGKTSMIANLLRSLVDGDPFLGAYTTHSIERILLIDTELDERMLRRWLRQQSIKRSDAINVLCLRGRLSTFDIVDDHIRAQWATRIDGAELIMLDCLRPCLDALGLSEDKEAGVFLTAFDALCRECGAQEAVVVHHMGHNSERSRGDSRLLDWPDVLWKIVRETDDDAVDDGAGDRFFSAVGRDVLVPESQLSWEPETRMLSICGAGRNAKKARDAFQDIIDIMSDPANINGLTQTQLVGKLKTCGVGRNAARTAIRFAVDDRVLLVSTGPRESIIHILNPSWRNR